MWIKKIHLHNFQCHSDLSYEFSPRVNAITGESDRGKSAIIRAIRWVIFNKPDGLSMRKAGTPQVMVSLVLDDDTIVTRIKSNAISRYTLEKPGQDTFVLDNFGTGVPAPIRDALNISPAKFGDNIEFELSIGAQFDTPFLLGESGITRSIVLGHLSKTGILDNATKRLGGEIRERGKFISLTKGGIDNNLKDLEAFADLPKEAERLEKIEQEIKALFALDKKKDFGIRIQTGLEQSIQQIAAHEVSIKALENIPNTTQLEAIALNTNRLMLIDSRLKTLQVSITTAEAAITKIDLLTPDVIGSMEKKAVDCVAAARFYDRTQEWKKRFTTNTTSAAETEAEFKKSVSQLVERIQEEKVCPTCLRELNAETLQQIQIDLESA